MPVSRNLAVVALVVALAGLGCTKNNSVSNSGAGGSTQCAGQACDGACVDGACRAYCTPAYTCSGDDVCTAVGDQPVCLPPDAQVYPPYAPFDMLKECAGATGCEIPLDQPPFQGVLRQCDALGQLTPADSQDPNFDYAAACANTTTSPYFAVQGRRLYSVGGVNGCTFENVGTGPSDSLISYHCGYDQQDLSLATFSTSASFWRVVETGGTTYVWRGPDAQLYELSKDEPWTAPSGCHFYTGDFRTPALPEDCALPTYPSVGDAVGADFAGLWVSCDTPNATAPQDCDVDFTGPAPGGVPRTVLYIDAHGFGQRFWSFDGVDKAQPTACDAAFRLVTRHFEPSGMPAFDQLTGIFVESQIPFGDVAMFPGPFEQIVTVTSGTGTAPGTYLVINNGSNYAYKQVPLPSNFVDPCQGTEPTFTW